MYETTEEVLSSTEFIHSSPQTGLLGCCDKKRGSSGKGVVVVNKLGKGLVSFCVLQLQYAAKHLLSLTCNFPCL